ncbi:UPF0158 family protein [Paenibacillus roseipurpureus]|uniref:UPF0158 family protein n=1 Tax=Paenibacillus roseopurpureus TaxID=2918901 RepID=A0AA96RMZ3_9BACL|nr:UPF0158 family protein [Paenibacillus sp. MBLB1832]WNR46849.1 UPF0158 family protein [Paenibacillus sp. MBLB1832]
MKNNKPVKLEDLSSEIELQIDDTFTFINTNTGEVITLMREEMRAAEDEEPLEKFPDWQRENIEKAIGIIEDDDGVYVDFTLRNNFNEYEIMEEFIVSHQDQKNRGVLYNAIQGRGAFRRFKDKIIELGVDKQWYTYKESKIRQLVIEWCKEHNITIQD